MQTFTTKSEGNQYFSEGEYALAAKMYCKYVSNPHDDNKAAYSNLALCYYKLERYEECIEACNEAIKLDKEYVKVYFRLAFACEKAELIYHSFRAASEFLSRSESGTQEFTDIVKLKERMRLLLKYPQPKPIDSSLNAFLEEFSSSQKKETLKDSNSIQKEELFKGYSWKDVQENLSSGEIGLALNNAYGVGLNEKDGKEQKNNGNLEIVKKIKKGNLNIETKLNIELNTPLSKTKEISSKSLQILPEIPQSSYPLPITDPYCNYFVSPLQKKLDIFEGFPTTIQSIVSNQAIQTCEVEEILLKASKELEMWTPLQISMSDGQKREVKKAMESRGINKSIIDLYCL